MEVVYLPNTTEDLRWFRRYCTRHSPEGQKRARKHLYAAEIMLSANPRCGHILGEGVVRELQIAQTPFSAIYAVRNYRIEIVRLWDGRADRSALDIR